MAPGHELDNPLELRDTLSVALRELPGARTLHSFGSLADGRGDRFSDIDLRITTEDLAACQASFRTILSRVHPIALEWTIEDTDTSWVATILFDGISPFHKLDIGISEARSHGLAGQPGFVPLWTADSRTGEPLHDLARSQPPYTPALGSIQHDVLGQLLGVTRYAKARRRRQVFTSWRFASALIDALLALQYMRAFPDKRIARKLTTGEYLELDGATGATARERFFTQLDLSSPEAMDATVHNTALELIALGEQLTTNAPIPPAVITLFTEFFDAELRPR